MFRTLVEGARGTWRIEVVAHLHLRSRDLKLQRNFARNPSTESHLGPLRKKPRLKIVFSLSWIYIGIFEPKKDAYQKKMRDCIRVGAWYPLNLSMDIHEIPKFGANPFGPILWAQRPWTLSKFRPVFFGDLGLHANFLDQTARLEMVGCWFLYSTPHLPWDLRFRQKKQSPTDSPQPRHIRILRPRQRPKLSHAKQGHCGGEDQPRNETWAGLVWAFRRDLPATTGPHMISIAHFKRSYRSKNTMKFSWKHKNRDEAGHTTATHHFAVTSCHRAFYLPTAVDSAALEGLGFP